MLGVRGYRFLLGVTVCIAAGQAIFILALLRDDNVSTFELDRDRAYVAEQVMKAQADSAKYTGGVLKAFIDLRVAVLAATAAMLDQKRTALFRRIWTTYTVDSKPVREASNEELNQILDELKQAEDSASASRAEAARYTGGLVQSLALMKAATDDVSVSQLRLKFYAAKHGLPVMPFAIDDKQSIEKKPLGKIVGDKEAL
jgi:hypothetical protein